MTYGPETHKIHSQIINYSVKIWLDTSLVRHRLLIGRQNPSRRTFDRRRPPPILPVALLAVHSLDSDRAEPSPLRPAAARLPRSRDGTSGYVLRSNSLITAYFSSWSMIALLITFTLFSIFHRVQNPLEILLIFRSSEF